MSKTETLKGVTLFFSETGTEGGDWAFQDERHIKKNVPRGYCKKCGKWLMPQEGVVVVKKVTQINLGTKKIQEVPDCPNDIHEEEVGDVWSYDGLHVLEDGDVLTIYDPDNPKKIIWTGTISLKQYDVFTKHANGFWIHADQNGISRQRWARWFLKEHPAMLVRKKKTSRAPR